MQGTCSECGAGSVAGSPQFAGSSQAPGRGPRYTAGSAGQSARRLAEKVIAPVRGRTMMPPGLERLESVLESAEAAVVPHIMSEQEIMHKYRKISTSVRIASRLFTSS